MTAPSPAPFPSQPGGPDASRPPKKMGKAPKILMIVGGVILALSLIAGTALTVFGVGSTAGGINDIEIFEGGSGVITVEQSDVIQLYAEDGTVPPDCQVTGPAPDAVGEGTIQTSSTTVDGRTWSSFGSFTANVSGAYAIDCGGTAVAAGPPVSIGGILGAIGGILLGLGGGFLGFVILLLGLILWLVGRRSA